MEESPDINQHISPAETASVSNGGSEPLSLSLICDNGCRVDPELSAGQALEFTAGDSKASIVLHHGDPKNLLIIKPESAS